MSSKYMIGRYIATGILALGIASGCATTSNQSKHDHTNASHQIYSSMPPDTSFAFVLERYGEGWFSMPHYKVGITDDGLVIYAGAKNVNTRGIKTSRISGFQVDSILYLVPRDYFEMDSKCLRLPGDNFPGVTVRVDDAPLTRTTVTLRYRSGSIARHNSIETIDGVNPGLDSLEARIENLPQITKWVKGK